VTPIIDTVFPVHEAVAFTRTRMNDTALNGEINMKFLPICWNRQKVYAGLWRRFSAGFVDRIAVLAILFCCLISRAETEIRVDRLGRFDAWELTRKSDLIAVADVVSADTNITVSFGQTWKGQAGTETFTFAAPPLPMVNYHGFGGPPRTGWNFGAGEKWILFFEWKEGARNFVDGSRKDLETTLMAVKACMDVDALTNDLDKVRMLVKLITEKRAWSSHPALLTLESLNRPEFLDFLAPLAENPSCKHAYITLLQDNKNPKTVDLLRAMLHKEKGKELYQVIDTFGRKARDSESVSKDLVSFLNHPDPDIRSLCVFLLNYRDYDNAAPLIVKALDDPAPVVRASALAWSWYKYLNKYPEVKTKMKKLRYDPDPEVRDAAKRALACISSWYRFWY